MARPRDDAACSNSDLCGSLRLGGFSFFRDEPGLEEAASSGCLDASVATGLQSMRALARGGCLEEVGLLDISMLCCRAYGSRTRVLCCCVDDTS